MRSVLTLFVLAMMGSICVFPQSVYQLQYNFHQPNDSITYNAFLVRFDAGSGLLRVRYIAPNSNQDVLIEADLNEDYATDERGNADTNLLVLTAANPRFIIGNDKSGLSNPVFLFKNNVTSGYFEPAAVRSQQNLIPSPNTSFAANLIQRPALTKDVVLQFFSEDEDFYINLFNDQTRGLTSIEKNTKLHLIVVADTLDKSIGSSCSKDMKRAAETFSGLTNFLGIKMTATTICGKQYSKKNVQAAISGLKPAANDIVVFYYSGHGFRLPEQPNRRFPFLKLKTLHKGRQDVIDNSLNVEDIFTSIKKKGARFNLVLSDCCNNDIFSENAKGSKPSLTRGSGVEWSEDNIRTLFLNKIPMSLLATAASSGQKASSNDDFGGFFSYFFKTSMENYSSKLRTNVTWDLVMQDAQKQTIFKANHTYCDKPYVPANICQQNPDYKILFGK